MPAPTFGPTDRDPDSVAPTDSYHRFDRVWVYRGTRWCAGVVEQSSHRAATVTYRPGSSRGTAVDTLTAMYLVPRDEPDPVLDRSVVPTGHHAARQAS